MEIPKKKNFKQYLDIELPAFGFISFTTTFSHFYTSNYGPRPRSAYSSEGKEFDRIASLHNLSNYFNPTTKFFFGCKREHVLAGSDWRKKQPGSLKFYRHTAVPVEVTWPGHEMNSEHDPKVKVQFRQLTSTLQRCWTTFVGILRNADETGRLFFGDDWHKHDATLKGKTNYYNLGEFLAATGICAIEGNQAQWPKRHANSASNPTLSMERAYSKAQETLMEDRKRLRRYRVHQRRNALINEMSNLARETHGWKWKTKLLKIHGSCTKPI